MPRSLSVLALLLAALAAPLAAQPYPLEPHPVFDDTRLPSVYIDLPPDSLTAVLSNVRGDREYGARFVFDTGVRRDTVEQVGFRLRGNTSRESRKKSFKVSFNTFVRGRKFYGLEKLNLNGEHNDPSVVRAKLAWDLFGTVAVPASRANHVRLYVNGAYHGLYINVEHIDEQFLQARFGDDSGNLYKCLWPADLRYITPGDASAYRPTDAERRPYDLAQGESDAEGYDDLAHLISVLNRTPSNRFVEAIEQVFDVNSLLRVLAVDVATGSWDDYWYLKNNFYLYRHPATGRFHFIPYDYDNTFGVDFVQEDWGRRDVYAWGHPSESRPLAQKLLAVPDYRDRYTFYLRRLLEGAASPAVLLPRIEALRQMIAEAATTDPNYPLDYGWQPNDFHRSYTAALGGHVEYGLTEFVRVRAETALAQLDAVDVPPILSGLRALPRQPQTGEPVAFTVFVEDESVPGSVVLAYRPEGGNQATVAMADDGRHGDGAAGDGVYGAILPAFAAPAALSYTVAATDASRQTRETPPATLQVGYATPGLFVNEIMADNEETVHDEAGQAADWIELYNATDAPLSLAGYTLTDNFDYPSKWALPDVTVPPHGFVLVWADGDADQGPLHASFSLDRDGEQVGLYDPTGAPVSTFSFEEQEADVSYGRTEDGGTLLAALPRPTPGATNAGAGVGSEPLPEGAPALSLAVYPNPSAGAATLRFDLPRSAYVVLELCDGLGRRLHTLTAGPYPAGTHEVDWNGGGLAAGRYFARLSVRDTPAAPPQVRTTPVTRVR